MMKTERPIEPNNCGENPEQWAQVADWESERADNAESDRECLQAELDSINGLGTLGKFFEALGWQGGTVHDAVAEVRRLVELGRRQEAIIGDTGLSASSTEAYEAMIAEIESKVRELKHAIIGECPSCGCGLFADGTNGGHSVADCQLSKLQNDRDALLAIMWRAGMFIKAKGVELENQDDEDNANQFYIVADEVLMAYDRIKFGKPATLTQYPKVK